jgi:hypothetical protein
MDADKKALVTQFGRLEGLLQRKTPQNIDSFVNLIAVLAGSHSARPFIRNTSYFCAYTIKLAAL